MFLRNKHGWMDGTVNMHCVQKKESECFLSFLLEIC